MAKITSITTKRRNNLTAYTADLINEDLYLIRCFYTFETKKNMIMRFLYFSIRIDILIMQGRYNNRNLKFR